MKFSGWRHWGYWAVAVGVGGVQVAVWAGSAYLPKVGPVPLRFFVPPPASTNWVSLPAPILPDQMPVEEEPTNSLPEDAPTPESVEMTASTPTVASPQPQQQQSAPPVDNTVISPQMLVKFFTPQGNTNSPATPQQPMGFTPPPPLFNTPSSNKK